jgi:hypothetical protein
MSNDQWCYPWLLYSIYKVHSLGWGEIQGSWLLEVHGTRYGCGWRIVACRFFLSRFSGPQTRIGGLQE